MVVFEEVYGFLEKKYGGDKASELTVGFVGGLVGGLIWGIAGGLIWGLVGGLIWGFGGGLIWGLAGGFASGLIWGLAGGIVGGLGAFQGTFIAIAILSPPIPMLYTIITIVLLAEALFWLSKIKPEKKENILHFTVKRKIIALIESSFIVLQIEGLTKTVPIVSEWIGLNEKAIQSIMCFLGWGTITIAIIAVLGYGWVKINSLKYKNANSKALTFRGGKT